MARRKKEPQSVHRKNITAVAQKLFSERGIENVTMNDIAKESGFSKATLYVYFKNKEELVSILVFDSMQKLYDYIEIAVNSSTETKTAYDNICNALVKYHEEFPFYFEILLKTIRIDFETTEYLPEEKETFLIGEKINNILFNFFQKSVEKGDIRKDIDLIPTIFGIWGMLSGLIMIGNNKEEYITSQMKISKHDFLQNSFDTIYNSIKA